MLGDLRLLSLDVIHAGDKTFPMAERARTVALPGLIDDVEALR
jgi:hypothetical protein